MKKNEELSTLSASSSQHRTSGTEKYLEHVSANLTKCSEDFHIAIEAASVDSIAQSYSTTESDQS